MAVQESPASAGRAVNALAERRIADWESMVAQRVAGSRRRARA